MRFTTVLLSLASTAIALPDSRSFRRPDSTWDFIVNADDGNQDISARNAAYLAEYSLRGKSVDPSSLNVDTVKQYSGYLDNKATDKHLFYCKYPMKINEYVLVAYSVCRVL